MPAAFALLIALSFNPPEDVAGPIQARIEAPATATALNEPMPARVVLKNSGETPLAGTVRVRVIDPWSIEPASAQWAASAGAETAVEFKVTPGVGTYNALYPIHAYVDFESGGARLTAHPVAIIECLAGGTVQFQPGADWRPLDVAAGRSLSLARMPIRRTVIQVNGEPPVVLPAGWQGSEERTRAAVSPGVMVQRPDSRDAIGIHPPWYNGLAGTALVEFPLRLPAGEPARFTAATAIRDSTEAEGLSDGVTFRVRVTPFDAPDGQLGEVLFERHSAAKQWEELGVDLSRFAGQAIRLQLESHPGPQNNTACDASYWGNPTVTAGAIKEPAAPTPLPSIELGAIQNDGRRYVVRVTPGPRGLLDAQIAFWNGDAVVAFDGFEARVLDDSIAESSALNALTRAAAEPSDNGLTYRHTFSSYRGTFDVVVHLYVDDGRALRAVFKLENTPAPIPWSAVYLEDVSVGPWTAPAERVYAGLGNVLVEPEPFDLGFDGHQLATSFVGFEFAPGFGMVQAVDLPPSRLHVDPRATRYTLYGALDHTMTFIPAPSVWDAVRVWRDINGLKPAPGIPQLAGRFVFDLWGGHYADSAEKLAKSFEYGMTNSAVVWHNWQRWGYDYRLPEIWPPNPQFGTLEEFQRLAQVCKDHGVLFALHDNYIDLYPDADSFFYDNVSFTPDGYPIRGWFNAGRGAQAYRWLTDAYRPMLEQNVEFVRDNTAASAYFIDVWSSIGPYDSWTRDGRFLDRKYTRDAWADAFNWIRETLGNNAPQISESGHDQLIGSLDGAQANHLRVESDPPKDAPWTVWRIKCKDSERIPWLDFAHHDRFALHGAGYGSRYSGGLDAPNHGIYSDDYICTEVLTGHPGMTPAPFSRDGVRKYWLLDGLMRALAGAQMKDVEFDGGDIHRQHVTWENARPRGAEVWVNRGADDWTLASGHILPMYGFYATANGTESAIERKDGVIVEWSKSEGEFYVNARQVAIEGRGNPERKVIDFGFAATNGAYRAVTKDGKMDKKPLPDEPEFQEEQM
ncbi:MAG TPA: hypothetical protein VMZ06_12815 [Candidatus Bathyarchaeia archaeon]|nr:hypothetical protein [Candidatus Bathyarchaeia archaeon]